MKILYVGNDRGAAQRAAGALRNAEQDVTVTWAGRLADALLWVRGNQDLGALVVEDEVQNQSCVRFVRQVRSLGLGVPIVIVSAKAGAPLAALKAGADDYIVDHESLLFELPGVFTRVRQRSEARGKPVTAPLRFLYLGDSALARECFESLQSPIEVVESAPDSHGQVHAFPPDLPADQPLPFDALLVEHGRPGVDIFAILKDVAARRPQFPVILVVEWDEELIVPAFKLGAIDYVMKTRDSFRAFVFRLDRLFANATQLQEQANLRVALQRAAEQHSAEMNAAAASFAQRQSQFDAQLSDAAATRATFEQKLAHAEMAVRAAVQRHAAMTTAVAELHERQGQYESELSEATKKRTELERQLNDVVIALEVAEQARSSDAAAAGRLAQRETELTATIAEVTAARESLERRLADAEKGLEAAERRGAAERQAALDDANRRQAELDQRLDEESAARGVLEKRLAHAASVVRIASERHASMKSAIAELTSRQAESDARLAQAITDRDALDQQLREAVAAFDQAERMRASNLAGTVDRFTRREAQFVTTIAETTAERDRLERRLTELEIELKGSEQRAAAERESSAQAKSQRESEFEAQLGERDAALKQAEQRALRERLIAVHEASERQAALQAKLDDEVVIRTALEEKLAQSAKTLADTITARDTLQGRVADIESSLRRTEQRASAELQEASQRYSVLSARLDAEAASRTTVEEKLAHSAATCDALEKQLRDAGLALEGAKLAHARDTKTLADTTSARDTLQRRVADVERALQVAEQRATVALQAASDRHVELSARLEGEATARATVEEQLTQSTAACERLEKRLSDAGMALERAKQVHTLDVKTFADLTAARDALQRRLTEVESATQLAEQRASAALQEASQRESALTARLDEERTARTALEETLTREISVRGTVEQRLAESAAMCVGLEKELSDAGLELERAQQAHALDGETIADLTAARDTLQLRLTEVESAMQHAEQRASVALQQASQREGALTARLDEEETTRTALEDTLTREVSARGTVEQKLAESAAMCVGLEKQLSDAGLELERAKHAHALDLKTLAATTSARDTFQRRVAEVESALQLAEQRASAALQEAAERQAELNARLEGEMSARTAVEQKLAQEVTAHKAVTKKLTNTETQLREAAARHASEMTTAAQQFAEQSAQHEAVLAHASATRRALEEQIREAGVAIERVEQARTAESAAAAERLALRETEVAATVAEMTAAAKLLEQRLGETEAILKLTEQRAAEDWMAAEHEAAERQTEFQARLAERDAELTTVRADAALTRETLEHQLVDSESTIREAIERYAADMAAAAAQLADARSEHERYEAEATAIRGGLEEHVREAADALEQMRQALAAETATLADTIKARGALQHRLAESELALQLVEKQASADREAAARDASSARAEFESRIALEVSKSEGLERGLAEARSSADAAERHFLDEIAALKQDAATRETRLNEQIARDRADRQSMQARLETKIRHLEENEAALRRSLDDTHAAHQRHFERAPSSLLRCSPSGTVEEVNRALAGLLGYRTVDELKKVDFATRVFESSSDVQSLIGRCLSNGTTESVETTWKRKDGVRIVVRLLAHSSTSGTIEIVVEDLTSFRALEERLRQAQRMEAVGRLASEVATTCDHLLRDVSQDGQEWLAMIDGGTPLRQQGELLLDEVTRAASLLRQLELYGKKQASTLEPVDIDRVLRDLQPVLKRVVGDDIEFVLPNVSQRLKLAVEPERVERILVNVAAFGRERMPFGGRLTIEVANVVVDRETAEQHTSLRPGAHALLTVTAVRYAVRWDTAIRLESPAEGTTAAATLERPSVGVDLGAMQALIRECGGHLWMAADPPGDMVLKIHLPQSAVDVPVDRRASASVTQQASVRPITRWFRTRH